MHIGRSGAAGIEGRVGHRLRRRTRWIAVAIAVLMVSAIASCTSGTQPGTENPGVLSPTGFTDQIHGVSQRAAALLIGMQRPQDGMLYIDWLRARLTKTGCTLPPVPQFPTWPIGEYTGKGALYQVSLTFVGHDPPHNPCSLEDPIPVIGGMWETGDPESLPVARPHVRSVALHGRVVPYVSPSPSDPSWLADFLEGRAP